ncbi:hypothetical protein glysoja_049904, partial [Glycine soja]
EELFWKDKARLNWFTRGDRNTAFVHKFAKQRRALNHISVLGDGDCLLQTQDQIQQHIIHFYSALFATDNKCRPNNLISSLVLP